MNIINSIKKYLKINLTLTKSCPTSGEYYIMKSIKKFENKKVVKSFSINSGIGGERIVGDSGSKGRDVSVLRDGQVKKYITGSGLFDGADRD